MKAKYYPHIYSNHKLREDVSTVCYLILPLTMPFQGLEEKDKKFEKVRCTFNEFYEGRIAWGLSWQTIKETGKLMMSKEAKTLAQEGESQECIRDTLHSQCQKRVNGEA